MKWLLFTLLLTLCGSFAQARLTDPLDSLPYADQEIYLTTFHKCRSLNHYGAWWVGIDADVALGNFANLTSIMTSYDGKLLQQRIQQGFKSRELYRKINSQGYQLALKNCFGIPESNFASKFAHQSVLIALYSTEFAATAGVAIGVVKGAPLLATFFLAHRVAAVTLIMTQAVAHELISEQSAGTQLARAIEEMRAQSSPDLSTKAGDGLSKIRAQLIEIKRRQLADASMRLKDSRLTTQDLEQIRLDYERLYAEIQELKAINPSF